jgi:two-component system, NtrC family, response regulator GlrR
MTFWPVPFGNRSFAFALQNFLQHRARKTALPFTRELKNPQNDVPLIGESPAFLRVIDKIFHLARVDQAVLISGETGTGKEVVARAIHYQSHRQGKPFIPVNCGALPDHLFENELFGHARGAFTDASSAEKGLIAEAEGGTLFLDEIDSLSIAAQVKLLRFLESGEYRPLGSCQSKIADVRVIAATNAELLERIKARAFREDLYYRINALSVSVPPLRDRLPAVVSFVNHFLSQYARQRGEELRGISKSALGKRSASERERHLCR